MNKFINVLLLLITFPTVFFTIVVGFDITVEFLHTSGARIPFRFYVFLGLGLLLSALVIRRLIRRWMGLKMVNKQEKYKWNKSIGILRKKRVTTYLTMEALVMTFLGFGLITISKEAWLPAFAYFLGAFDQILLMLIDKTKNVFRVGLTSKALVLADREFKIVYFSGLRKVSIHQQTMFFDYKDNFQMTLPMECLAEETRKEFKDMLEKQLNRDKVFFTENVKAL